MKNITFFVMKPYSIHSIHMHVCVLCVCVRDLGCPLKLLETHCGSSNIYGSI